AGERPRRGALHEEGAEGAPRGDRRSDPRARSEGRVPGGAALRVARPSAGGPLRAVPWLRGERGRRAARGEILPHGAGGAREGARSAQGALPRRGDARDGEPLRVPGARERGDAEAARGIARAPAQEAKAATAPGFRSILSTAPASSSSA